MTDIIHPVHNNLHSEMRCGIFTGPKGDIIIVHDQSILQPILWIEYTPEDHSFILVYEDGTIQNLGIDMPKNMLEHLTKGDNVTLSHIPTNGPVSSKTITFIVKEY